MVLFNIQTCKFDEFHPVHGRVSVTQAKIITRNTTSPGLEQAKVFTDTTRPDTWLPKSRAGGQWQ